jgi:hypothetical protein
MNDFNFHHPTQHHPTVTIVDSSYMAAVRPLSIVRRSVVDVDPGPEDQVDVMSDETVVKSGWLSKKGRRGVSCPVYLANPELEETVVCPAYRPTSLLQRRESLFLPKSPI